MSNFEWTQRSPSTGDGGFYFFERTGRRAPVYAPLNKAVVESWVVGGQYGGGPIMARPVSLPVEVFRVNGIPVYYDSSQNIWFVNGYPENFVSADEARLFAESLIPSEGGVIPPPPSEPNALASLFGLGALLLLLV